MSLTLRDMGTPTGSRNLFKSAVLPTEASRYEDLGKSQFMDLEASLNSTLKKPSIEVDLMSSYVRLETGCKDEKLKKVVPRFSSAVVPLSSSLILSKHRVVSDAALFHNRRFRIGWGPDLMLCEADPEQPMRILLSFVDTSDFKNDLQAKTEVVKSDSKNPCVALLSTYLDHAEREIVDGVPRFRPARGNEAIGSLKSATASLISRLKSTGHSKTIEMLLYTLKVWNLSIALWGPLESEEIAGHARAMARKEALTHWLEEATLDSEIIGLHDEEEVRFITLFCTIVSYRKKTSES